MTRAAVMLLCLLPVAAAAQDVPAKPSASAQLAAQLAGLLATASDERDACRAQLAAKQPPPEAKQQP